MSKITTTEEQEILPDNPEENDEPVIEFVDCLIQEAIQKQVSDIHLEPYQQYCRIRFRCDGLLSLAASVPLALANRIITRLKIMANLNIAERRRPQDGRIKLPLAAHIDIRTNTCPTLYGEKIVLRILDMSHINLKIDSLGMTAAQNNLFHEKLSQPQGLILVTGPTGSGKTVTLYSALHDLNQIEKNISTVEDPVEIELAGINQVNIHPRIGLDFAVVLRSLLRQDPDIILVGEIRDAETANIAMQAAQTGHLVLSSLHTNSAAETIIRLQSIGVSAYHLISSISLIIAQRLVRVLCSHCQGNGCAQCYQGYQGRIGIFELLPVTESIATLILSHANTAQILEKMQQEGCLSLWEAGMEKVRQGITSLAELERVLVK